MTSRSKTQIVDIQEIMEAEEIINEECKFLDLFHQMAEKKFNWRK